MERLCLLALQLDLILTFIYARRITQTLIKIINNMISRFLSTKITFRYDVCLNDLKLP